MYANGIPTKNVNKPATKQPIWAVVGDLAAKQRAWKSKAAKLPKPRTKIVAQLNKIAFGNGVYARGSLIDLS